MAPLKNENDIYNGNGWSQYQRLVMSQLDNLTELIRLNSEKIEKLERNMAVFEERYNNFKEEIRRKQHSCDNQMDYIFNDEKGLNAKVRALETKMATEEKSDLKVKAVWGFIGGIIIIIINIIFEVIKTYGQFAR